MVRIGANHVDPVAFRRALIAWGTKHFRDLPWRSARSAYRVLMAEVMLHRTQARQVAPVYKAFVRRYPNPSFLAAASRKDLRHTLYSLGLRWRIDLVRAMVGKLANAFGGNVPRQKAELLSLPGVSDYIASAVRCFAFNFSEPLVDTNTVRVVGRIFGRETKDSSRRNRQFRELIAMLLDHKQPRSYNYALLDLASEVCHKAKPPDCQHCPVRRWCLYGRTGGRQV